MLNVCCVSVLSYFVNRCFILQQMIFLSLEAHQRSYNKCIQTTKTSKSKNNLNLKTFIIYFYSLINIVGTTVIRQTDDATDAEMNAKPLHQLFNVIVFIFVASDIIHEPQTTIFQFTVVTTVCLNLKRSFILTFVNFVFLRCVAL